MGMCSEARTEEEMSQKMEMTLRRSVKCIHFGTWEEKESAAKDIKKLAEDGVERRKVLVEYGVIPPLVAMVGSEVLARQILAVQALAGLANGSYTNKSLIVEAGILSNLPRNICDLGETYCQEFAELLLSISTLANSQFSLPSATIIPILVSLLESSSSNIETKQSCLTALYILSSVLDNTGALITSGVVRTLMEFSVVELTSEKALATLGNLVVTIAGRIELEHNPMIPEGLIKIMKWENKPKCQELSSYILMVLAHYSSFQREKMSKAGIVQVLLEVALLGSPLAQKRALKILQSFKNERQTRMRNHSGPQARQMPICLPVQDSDVDEEKKMMKEMVNQSLYKTMDAITRRASAGDSSKLKSLVVSSTSKSLPY